jgi:hypothetical protein
MVVPEMTPAAAMAANIEPENLSPMIASLYVEPVTPTKFPLSR